MSHQAPRPAGLYLPTIKQTAELGPQLLAENAALLQTVEAANASRIRFAYRLDARSPEEYSDPLEGLHDYHWPEIVADELIKPAPFYTANRRSDGGWDVDTVLMGPQTEDPAKIRMHGASFEVQEQSLVLHKLSSRTFTHENVSHGKTSGLEGPEVIRGLMDALAVLRSSYTGGAHAFWDVQ